MNEQKKSQLLLEAKAEPSEWEKDKQELETEIERYRNSYNDALNSASQNYAYAQSVEKQLLTVGIVAVVLLGQSLFYRGFTFSGERRGGQWRSCPLSHFEKMTLADFSKSANFQKMSLWFEDFFCSSPWSGWVS